MNSDNWRLRAACRGMDVNLFFADRDDPCTAPEAQQVCNTCPVRQECLHDGLYERYGVWGGTTEKQRRALRRTWGIPEKSCVVCGDTFIPRKRSMTTCSPSCSEALAAERKRRATQHSMERHCPICGTSFHEWRRGVTTKYCSQQCARAAKTAHQRRYRAAG